MHCLFIAGRVVPVKMAVTVVKMIFFKVVISEYKVGWFIENSYNKINVIHREIAGAQNEIYVRKCFLNILCIYERVYIVGDAEDFHLSPAFESNASSFCFSINSAGLFSAKRFAAVLKPELENKKHLTLLRVFISSRDS